MKPKPTAHLTEYTLSTQRADWFDETHDTVFILEGRESEENGNSPLAEMDRS